MSDEAYLAQLEIQRRAFEAQFGALEDMGFHDATKEITNASSDDDDHSEDDSDASVSSRLSKSSAAAKAEFNYDADSGNEHEPQSAPTRQTRVIKFNAPSDHYIPLSKKEQRLLKSGKTSLVSSKQETTNDTNPSDNDDDQNLEEENLKNDIELQRFLKESHLLSALSSSTASSGADLTLKTIDNLEFSDNALHGKVRTRTLEMRMQALSSQNSKSRKLEKVPIAIRKGMIDKHLSRIRRHEQEARDAGIILPSVKKGQFRKIDATYKRDLERRIGSSIKKKDKVREQARHRKKGIKINAVGKSTRNGLIISNAEIARVTGSSGSSNSKKPYKKKHSRK